VLAALGIAWHPLRSTPSRRLGLSIRADLLGEYLRATASESANDRMLAGADAVLEAGWLVTSDAEIIAGAGGEMVYADTHIGGPGANTSLTPLRAVAEAGMRLRF